MAEDILIRIVWSAAIIALGLGLFWGWNRWQLRRLNRQAGQRLPGLESLRPGTAAVLYFTTPDCLPCRTAQRPALERLQAEMGDDLQVIEIDASANTATADYWGVLSVPTTFIIDAQGQPRRVNHGVTSREKLARQVSGLSGAESDPPAMQLSSNTQIDCEVPR